MTAFTSEQQAEIGNLIDRATERHGTLIRQLQGFCAAEPWIIPTVGGGFTADPTRPPKYYRAGDRVFLTGRLSALGATGTTIFTLPAGYRPANDGSYPAMTSSASYPAAVVILATGAVQPFYSAGSSIALDNISFRWEQ